MHTGGTGEKSCVFSFGYNDLCQWIMNECHDDRISGNRGREVEGGGEITFSQVFDYITVYGIVRFFASWCVTKRSNA